MKDNSEETKAAGGVRFLSLNAAAAGGGGQRSTTETSPSAVWLESSGGMYLPASRLSLSDTNNNICNESLEHDGFDALPTIKGGMMSSSAKHYKIGDVVWSQRLREYLKLEKGVGKTPSGKQYWDCQTLYKQQLTTD